MEVIVELRAGLMRLADGRLVADPRKGLIRVCQDDAGLTHFCWSERDATTGAPVSEEAETDMVIIPGECAFNKIARPGSRVFELRFPEEKHRNMFFWAQEVDGSTDEDYVAAINMALNLEAEEEEHGGGGGGAQAMDADTTPEPAAAPAAAPAPATAPAPAAGGAAAVRASDLAAILGSIMSGAAGGGMAAAAAAERRAALDPGPTLGDVLRPEALAPLLRDPDMVQRLAPFLPEEHRNADAICELVSTPQFRHQLDLLSHALMTGQLDTRQFGLPAGGFGVTDFLRSIQEKADREKAQRGQQGGGGGGGGDGAQQ